MRYIVNSDNCVLAVSFGAMLNYADCDCTEYTGTVPSGWDSLEEWNEDEGNKLWRWKIIDGNLVLDSTATAPEEGRWGVPELQDKTVTGMILEETVITADEDYDGLSSVTIAAQPGWKHLGASTNAVYVISSGQELAIQNDSNGTPKAIIVEYTDYYSNLSSGTIAMLCIELDGSTVTGGFYLYQLQTTVSLSLNKGTNISGFSVDISDGIIVIHASSYTFHYTTASGGNQKYQCYLMY